MKKVVLASCLLAPAAAMAMADSTPPVYGRPTLYGEYEATGDAARRAAKIYGDAPRVATMNAKTGASSAKRPVKAKPVAPKKAVKKKANKKEASRAAATPSNKEKAPVVASAAAAAAHDAPADAKAPKTEKKTYAPSATAVAIAGAAGARDMRNVDSYCTRRATRGRTVGGNGIVLMPGRPDLMSCVEK